MEFFSPNPLRTFSDPYDANKYNDKPISRDMVSEVFQEFVSGTRERESEEYLRTLSGEKMLCGAFRTSDLTLTDIIICEKARASHLTIHFVPLRRQQ